MKTNTLQIEHNGESITLSRVEPTPSDKPVHIPGSPIAIPATLIFEAVSPSRGNLGRIQIYKDKEVGWMPVGLTTLTREQLKIAQAAAIAFNSPQWDDTFEGKDRKAFLSYDDADQHEEGCRCGKCDANGTSHGMFVFAVPKEGCRTADDFDAAAEEQENYPLSRIYAPSEEAALNNARLWCEMQGFEVIERPNPPSE